MFKDMDRWTEIRKKILVEGVSKRQVMEEEGIHWETLQKILAHSQPPGYRMGKQRPQPKIGSFLGRIEQILEDDKHVHKKQHHTAKRIFERLRKEDGYTGGYTQVKKAVRGMKQRRSEVFVPLTHRPGEAQVDFGHALVKLNGVLVKRPFFVMALPYSDAFFVQMFERESTEFVWEGHIRAFEYFGGVPWRISYDNAKTLVSKIAGVHKREITRSFQQLESHYLFDHHFCTIRRGNEKGIVEGGVKYVRLNFMVPVPQVGSLEELNEKLLVNCREDMERKLRGKYATKAKLLEEEKPHFRPLPATAFDACLKQSTTATSLSLVRFDTNDYSVPSEYAHHPVVVKGYMDRVDIFHREKLIAAHSRLWIKEGVTFNPVHYLAVLEGKPGALDHARPLEDWQLHESFTTLRRRMESKEKFHGDGTREYIKTLRLLEKHSMGKLTWAVKKAAQMEIYTRDAVAQLLYPQENFRLTTFSLAGREHLRRVQVARTDLSAYRELMAVGGEA
ncbi:MAG: IS21 family transposase [Candidatus Dormibacteraceae bacterium]